MEELRQKVIAALRREGSVLTGRCIKLLEGADDPTKVVLPVSMSHLDGVITAALLDALGVQK